MSYRVESEYLNLLRDRINLDKVPFSERGSRLMIFRSGDTLAVRLAERWFKLDSQLSSYRRRAPILTEWAFTDEAGNVLPLVTTTYPHCVLLATPAGEHALVFVDQETLLLTLPAGRHTLRFRANLDNVRTDRRGGVLGLTGDIRRNIAYTTNGRLVEHEVEPTGLGSHLVRLAIDCPGECAFQINITPRLGFNRHLSDPAAAIDAAAQRWHDWFAAAPPVHAEYRAQYYYAWWIMRAGIISSRFYTTREAMTPSKVHYVGIWQWDAYFHALAYRHVEPRLAQDQIRVVLDHQRADGMIPDAVHDEGVITRLSFPVEADVTKPPLLAWCAWKLFEMDGDREFLEEIYEPITRWNDWWFAHNDTDRNGLCEYQHPFSSGLDDSPLWDDGMPVEAPDLNTHLCLQMETLSKMAAVIGETAASDLWRRRADELARRMIDDMWDEDAGLFWAYQRGHQVQVKTPFNLFPLLTGRMPPAIERRLLAHLADPAEFWTRYPVPTVARNDAKYNPWQMWRGPTWINVNYLLIEGLERIGRDALARDLRRRTLELLNTGDDICEYYHPETGEIPEKAAPIFGWSAALFIEMAIQESRL